jgi:hypothetical protein
MSMRSEATETALTCMIDDIVPARPTTVILPGFQKKP